MGNLRSLSIELYNCGQRVQVLAGYPRVKLLDARLKPIKLAVGRGASYAAAAEPHDGPTVELGLRPGEVATARIFWRDQVRQGRKGTATAQVLEIAPRPGAPFERLSDVSIELGTIRRLGIGTWERVREAGGAEVGDNAPHYRDNHAWQRTVEVDATGRLAGEMAARKIRPALEQLRAKGGFTVDAVRTTLRGLGFSGNSDGASEAADGVAYAVYPGGGSCVVGVFKRDRLTVKVGSVRLEGGCGAP